MSTRFVELDAQDTPLGLLSLWRRLDPSTGVEVHEVKLGEEYLMSSQFTHAEVELARLSLQATDRGELDVVVGGLGLGYTAGAMLADERVRDLVVVDALAPVIDWHRLGLVPLGPELSSDRRCRFLHGDFFALTEQGYLPGRRFDVVAVDIDHSPRHLLHPHHARFYTADGLGALHAQLRDGGVFALWSNDPPDEVFLGLLGTVFSSAAAQVVAFDNPLQKREATNTVYRAVRA